MEAATTGSLSEATTTGSKAAENATTTSTISHSKAGNKRRAPMSCQSETYSTIRSPAILKSIFEKETAIGSAGWLAEECDGLRTVMG